MVLSRTGFHFDAAHLCEEYRTFDGIRAPTRRRVVPLLLGDMAEVVRLKRSIHVLADEPDSRILECAVAGGADRIVIGIRAKKAAVGEMGTV
jgi:hypothetical protein